MNELEMPSLELRIGRLLFALSVVASGIYQLVTGRFVNLVPVNPAHVQPWQAYVLGVILVLIGMGLLVRRTVTAAAIALAILLLVLFFGFSLRVAIANAPMGYVWVDPLMILAILSGVGLTVVPPEGARSIDRVFEKSSRFVTLALGAFMAYCGALHFPYAKYVAGLIPPWIPGHMFWTYFAAVALIAGGIGVLVPQTARLAATLSGIMLISWFFLVHIPLAINTHTVTEVSRGFQALQDGAVALMLAGTVRSHKRSDQ
jgi:uncharacterized membrane protein